MLLLLLPPSPPPPPLLLSSSLDVSFLGNKALPSYLRIIIEVDNVRIWPCIEAQKVSGE